MEEAIFIIHLPIIYPILSVPSIVLDAATVHRKKEKALLSIYNLVMMVNQGNHGEGETRDRLCRMNDLGLIGREK